MRRALLGLALGLLAAPPLPAGTLCAGPLACDVLAYLMGSGQWPWRRTASVPDARARVGFGAAMGMPRPGWRAVLVAEHGGTPDLPWGWVGAEAPPPPGLSLASPPDAPLPVAGASLEVPTTLDGLYGVLYRRLAAAPAPSPLVERLGEADPRVRRLLFRPVEGVVFGAWVREGSPALDPEALQAHLDRLPDSPVGDRLLLGLGAERLRVVAP